MSKPKDPAPKPAGVVNWDPPAKRDLVERAISDGVRDPKKIVDFAEAHDVAMTADEVKSLISEIEGQSPSAPSRKEGTK